MNSKVCKQLRIVALGMAAAWIKKNVPEDQQQYVNEGTVKLQEKDKDDMYYYKNNVRHVSSSRSRYFYQKLKDLYRKGLIDPYSSTLEMSIVETS